MRKSRLPSHGSMKTRLVDTKICIIIVPYGFIATTVLGYTISKRWIRIYGFSLRCIRICSIYQVDIGYMARCVRICNLKSNMGLDIQ